LNVPQLIQNKRDGHALTAEQIAWLIDGFVRGDVPDYQMSALAMAIYYRGMDTRETAALTGAMLHSGATITWPDPRPWKVDKHSTGGIGDKVSLILAPLMACCGLRVPMISGRGLGATGGTLDKLAAIPGFRTDLTLPEIRAAVERIGCVITGATADLVPADGKLYRLRDVTATVESIPLITASIMSKKLAEGLGALVLDVKFGSGALMKTIEQARELGRCLVDTGTRMGVRTSALLTDMNQPLGRMIGNAVEVDEAIATLAGGGPADLTELVLELGGELLLLTGQAPGAPAARQRLIGELASGRAIERFRAMVAAQGGDLDAPRPVAARQMLASDKTGWIDSIDGEALGRAVIELGGGRRRQDDAIDPSVGLEMFVRLGDKVELGDPLVGVFADPVAATRVAAGIRQALVIAPAPPPVRPLVAQRIGTIETV